LNVATSGLNSRKDKPSFSAANLNRQMEFWVNILIF